jgi:hypothetical protein
VTQTIDQPTAWPTPATDPNLDGIHVLTQRNTDYLKRVHWWVRLFGIVWIVIPVLAFLAAVAFALGALSLSASDNTTSTPSSSASYDRCLIEGFSATECGRWYPS